MIKLMINVVRKAGMAHEEFADYWRNKHGPLVKSVPEFTRYIRKYIQCHLAAGGTPLGAANVFDGVAELWFDNAADMERAFSEPRYLEIVRPDELKFADLPKCVSLITEEVSMI